MKLIKLLNFTLTALCCMLFFSCSNAEDSIESFSTENDVVQARNSFFDDDLAMREFFFSVDQLNKNYSHKVNSCLVNSKKNRADAADALVGAITEHILKNTKYDWINWIASPVASYLYSAFDEYLTKKNSVIVPGEGIIGGTFDPSLFDEVELEVGKNLIVLADTTKDLSFTDSIGYYHNLLLNSMRQISKAAKLSFVDSKGVINYSSCYSTAKLSWLIMKKPLPNDSIVGGSVSPANLDLHPFVKNDTLSVDEAIEQFTLSFVRSSNPVNGNSLYDSFEMSRMYSIDKIPSLDKKAVDNIRDLFIRINDGVRNLSNEECIDYCKNLNQRIENSGISNDQKADFKCLNNIFVNSCMYWNR